VSVVFVLVPIGLVIVALAIAGFLWAARAGQYDDLGTPAMRMLHDDEAPPAEGDDTGDTKT